MLTTGHLLSVVFTAWC